MGMYGNITSYQPHTNFNFYRTYANKAAMVAKIEEIPTDGTIDKLEYELINSYLLVDYSADGTSSYTKNHNIDKEKYGANSNFDLTVWQVRLIDNYPRCVAIARMHSVLPTFEVEDSYHIDLLEPMSEGDFFGKGKTTHI